MSPSTGWKGLKCQHIVYVYNIIIAKQNKIPENKSNFTEKDDTKPDSETTLDEEIVLESIKYCQLKFDNYKKYIH